jgi:rRNA-processing protein FCF1
VPHKPVVILDANALLMPFQFKINLDTELLRLIGDCEVLVPSSVIGELKRARKTNKNANAALTLAEKYTVHEVEGSGDDSLLELASDMKGIVITNDKGLIQRLKRSGIPVIYMRSRNHLVLERTV